MENFFERYYKLKANLAPFTQKTDFETVKTVSMINALADRAFDIAKGIVPQNKTTTVQNIFPKAEQYLAELKKGEFPLKGKFTEPGFSFVDHSFVEKDGKLHVFYIRATTGYDWRERPNDTIGHAVTEDLENFKILPPAVTVLPDNPYGNFQAWAPGVVKRGDTYYMYYTGVNVAVAQSLFLATSKDLYTWEYYENNPVYLPGDWCPWDINKWSNCRDSMTIVDDDGTAYTYFCTTVKTASGGQTNATGIIKSNDMINWEDVTQISFEGSSYAQESPFVIKHNGLYYLFYTACNQGTRYAVSKTPVGPFKEMGLILGGKSLSEDPSHVPSCSEVFEFKGQWYISYCTRMPGFEQYLEIAKLTWNEDGTVTVVEKQL